MLKWPFIIFICFLITACGEKQHEVSHAAGMSGVSRTLLFDKKMNTRFSELPLEGEVSDKNKNWSSDYWPLRRGGINYRWNAEAPTGFNLHSPEKADIAGLSIKQLSTLSPAEKYDLFVGDYGYSLKKEVASLANPTASFRTGICHGWALASIHHKEPLPKILLNPDGIRIPFGSSDIKALLSFYYAQETTMCDTDDCKEDLNAGTFHMTLANKVGVDKVAIIADIKRFKEIWNHPIISYESQILQDHLPPEHLSVPNTVRVLHVGTRISYVNTVPEKSWGPILQTNDQKRTFRSYEYTLELDSQNQIIGGRWISQDRPDFLWIKRRPKNFTGMFHRLSELLNDH